jgi:hypothetical protein
MSKRIRRSDELPDDEGVVFVTDVPGSWFQLYGRRAYGEFFVGGYIVPAKGQGAPAEAMPDMFGLIVRGPEVEALVALADELRGERIWRDALAAGVDPALMRTKADNLSE